MRALAELAEHVVPDPGLLARVQVQTRSVRRRRRLALSGGGAVAVAAGLAVVAVAAVVPTTHATTARLRPELGTTAASPSAAVPGALDAAHPWAFRGDATDEPAAVRSGLVPLWAGRVGTGDHAVLGLVRGEQATELLLLRADGTVEQRDRQPLRPGTRILADLVPARGTDRAQLLVLGPPGTGALSVGVAADEQPGSALDSSLTIDLAADHGAAAVPLTNATATTAHVVASTAAGAKPAPAALAVLARADVQVAALPPQVGADERAGTALDPAQPWVRRGSGTVRGAPAGFVTLWSGPDGAAGELAAIGVLPDGGGPGKATTLALVDRADGSVDVGPELPLAAGSRAVAAVISPQDAPPVVLIVATPVALSLQVQGLGNDNGLGVLTEQLTATAALIPPWQLGFPAATLRVTPLDQRQDSLGAGEIGVSGTAALSAPLTAAHPWAVRGDTELARVVAQEQGGHALPLWGGTVDGRAVAVILRKTASGARVVTVTGDAGQRVGVATQPLNGSTDLVAVTLPPAADGHAPTLLLLGPPGGRAAADIPGASQALAQSDDGTSTYPLPPGTTAYTGTVTVDANGAEHTVTVP